MSAKACSVTALVCGIVGLVFSWFGVLAIIALICSVVGIILGAMGMKKAEAENMPKGLAVGGLVCGIIGAAFSLIGVICYACILCSAAGAGLIR
ncbi:MAG: hypothetical protein IJT79_08120 [Ruminococcus sp.]|nr:hypothetical protein [Ruminococcus sp.]